MLSGLMPTVSMLSSNLPAVGMKCGPAPVSIRITSDAVRIRVTLGGWWHPFAALPSDGQHRIQFSAVDIGCHEACRHDQVPIAQHRDLAVAVRER
jgi:hypothetical protein